MNKLWIMGVAAAALVGGATIAHASCYEPSAPSCVSSYGSFDDQYEFDRCKRDVEGFKSETEDYHVCLQRDYQTKVDEAEREAKNKISESSDAYGEAVDSFNRRASN